MSTTTKNPKHMCMSFTAPQFSPRDEQRERDNLPPQVRDSLRQDLTGTAAILRETPEMLQACLEKFHEYLSHDEIPVQLKRAYQAAVQHASPTVLQQESDPIVFLRAEEYDAEAAALRMMNYWKIRQAIFGEKAFSSLQDLVVAVQEEEEERQRQAQLNRQNQEQQEDTTADEGDDETFGKVQDLSREFPVGEHVTLPDDRFGRPVVFFTEGQSRIDFTQTLRQSFLLFHQLAHQNDIYQRQGCVIVLDARRIDPDHFNRKQYRRKLEFLRDAVPIRIRAIHVCFAAFKSPARLLQPSILWMYGPKLRLRRKVHYGSRKILAQTLVEYGLKLEGLPPSLGGTLRRYKKKPKGKDECSG